MKLSAILRGRGTALCTIALALGVFSQSVAAQTTILPSAPLGGFTLTDATPARIHVAQAQDTAQLLVRIQQLEEQLRLQNGQVEGLTFQLTQLQEILNRVEARLSVLEGGSSAPAAQPGSGTAGEGATGVPTDADGVPLTEIPEQGVQPLPGEVEFDPTFDDGSAGSGALGESSDPLVGTGAAGGVDLATGQPLNLSLTPADTGNADADAQFRAGFEAMQSGDYAFAEDQFSQFIELYPNNPQAADAASMLGDALLQRAAYNEAADVLLEAYQKAPDSPRAPELLIKLGASISGAGEREVACRTFAQVEASYPDLAQDLASRLAAEKSRAECPPA